MDRLLNNPAGAHMEWFVFERHQPFSDVAQERASILTELRGVYPPHSSRQINARMISPSGCIHVGLEFGKAHCSVSMCATTPSYTRSFYHWEAEWTAVK